MDNLLYTSKMVEREFLLYVYSNVSFAFPEGSAFSNFPIPQ